MLDLQQRTSHLAVFASCTCAVDQGFLGDLCMGMWHKRTSESEMERLARVHGFDRERERVLLLPVLRCV
eukprot:6004-Eustigmatos_ZCMA.PRE.1